MKWAKSWRADPAARAIADRHYNRQKIGATQFVPPGRCVVLITPTHDALWVTSYPFARYVKHAWAGAWMNTTFRNERPKTTSDPAGYVASDLILDGVAATRAILGEPPALGMVSFVNPKEVRPIHRRGQTIYGYGYLMAGFVHVGFTKAGLWAWQLLPDKMPPAVSPMGELDLA